MKQLLCCCIALVLLPCILFASPSSFHLLRWSLAQRKMNHITDQQLQTRLSSLNISHIPINFEKNHVQYGRPRRLRLPRTSCVQASDIGATSNGASYRVDTNCDGSDWYQTSYTFCPSKSIALQGSDVVIQGTSFYNTQNGKSVQVGFSTSKSNPSIWTPYLLFQSKFTVPSTVSLQVNANQYPCFDVTAFIVNSSSISISAADTKTGATLGSQVFSGIDASVQMDPSGNNMGVYRMESIFQSSENLKSGSSYSNSVFGNWVVYDQMLFTLVNKQIAAYNIQGKFYPGPCCNALEKKVISITNQTLWYNSNLSFSYN